MNTLLRGATGLAAAGVSALAYASLVERNAFALRRYAVPVLPAGSRPLRVLHVSDLHLVPRQRRKISWVQRLADLEPDLVVNTGDNLADLDAVPAAVEAFAPLLTYPGVFVLGSNDYFAPVPKSPTRYITRKRKISTPDSKLPTDELVGAFTAAGWLDLDNSRDSITVAGSELDLVGVNDPHLEFDEYPAPRAAPASAAIRVGVMHAPYQRILDEMASDECGLLIAGHTHGGQLCVPFYGALVTNCDLDRSRAKGVSRWWPGAGSAPSSAAPASAAWLEVSAGLGTSPYAPVRFACRPEATLLTLVARD